MLDTVTTTTTTTSTSSDHSNPNNIATTSFQANAVLSSRRKRRPAGTPDPDAEVVSLSPKTLLESDRYVCEICNQGFQREQNLQMHRRRHKVPWKLLKRDQSGEAAGAAGAAARKRVFVCPEPSCLHHDPCHALGDLVGIKKHYRRKHSNHKQWVCDKCSKGYAVQSDYKAHLKTCGTRGHSCDCGRVFSRVESFIEHQDACTMRGVSRLPEFPPLHASAGACSSGTASSMSPSSDPNPNNVAPLGMTHNSSISKAPEAVFFSPQPSHEHNLELQLLPSSSNYTTLPSPADQNHPAAAAHLNLSIGINATEQYNSEATAAGEAVTPADCQMNMRTVQAAAEIAYAEEARRAAKRQLEMAEVEFSNAKRIRKQALAELEKAQHLKEQATRKLNSTLLEITCHSCKQRFQTATAAAGAADETSLGMSYMSSATTEGDGGGDQYYSK